MGRIGYLGHVVIGPNFSTYLVFCLQIVSDVKADLWIFGRQ